MPGVIGVIGPLVNGVIGPPQVVAPATLVALTLPGVFGPIVLTGVYGVFGLLITVLVLVGVAIDAALLFEWHLGTRGRVVDNGDITGEDAMFSQYLEPG